MEDHSGALVYLDALEFLGTEYSLETTLKLVNWLTTQIQGTSSAMIVSADRDALDSRDRSRLQRSFSIVD
jgi:hypothetical protein